MNINYNLSEIRDLLKGGEIIEYTSTKDFYNKEDFSLYGYFLIEGMLKAYSLFPDKKVMLFFLQNYETNIFLLNPFVILGNDLEKCNYEIIEPTLLLKISREELLNKYNTVEKVELLVMKSYEMIYNAILQSILVKIKNDTKTLIYEYLKQGTKYGKGDFKISKKNIALDLNLSRSTVSKKLKILEQEKKILLKSTSIFLF